MIITEEQVRFFETFGFLVRKNVFTADEVARYTEEMNRRAEESHHLVPFVPDEIGQGGRQHSLLVPSTPFLTALMEDERLAGAAEDMVGEIAWIGAYAHQFVGHSVWHFDGGCREWDGVNNLIYTQPVRADSGALRVLPGSPPLGRARDRCGVRTSRTRVDAGCRDPGAEAAGARGGRFHSLCRL